MSANDGVVPPKDDLERVARMALASYNAKSPSSQDLDMSCDLDEAQVHLYCAGKSVSPSLLHWT